MAHQHAQGHTAIVQGEGGAIEREIRLLGHLIQWRGRQFYCDEIVFRQRHTRGRGG